MKTLVVAPTRREAAAISVGAHPFVCGAGEAAGMSVTEQLATDRYDLVVVFGFCGALDPSLAAGALILSRQVLMEGAEPLTPNAGSMEQMRREARRHPTPFVSSQLLTVLQPTATRRAKTNLWNRYGAGGVDMETYHVARACAAAEVPWVAVRAVLDPAQRTLPRAARHWRDDGDEMAIRRDALRHPPDWPGYMLLMWELRRAVHALRTAFPPMLTSAEEGWRSGSVDMAITA